MAIGGITKFTKVELYGDNNDGAPIRYTIVDGVAVSKGWAGALRDPRTASAAVVADVLFTGIFSEEVISGDNPGAVSVYTQGIFEGYASGAIGLGAPVTFVKDNYISAAVGAASGATVIGHCLETAGEGELVNFRLNL